MNGFRAQGFCQNSVKILLRILAFLVRGQPVSRILFPCLAAGSMTIPLGCLLPDISSCQPGSHGQGGLADPYLALLPVGLAVPVRLPVPRWALTPPFHPDLACKAVCFLWRFPWSYLRRALPGTVTLWSPDFPRRAPQNRTRRSHPAIRACRAYTAPSV